MSYGGVTFPGRTSPVIPPQQFQPPISPQPQQSQIQPGSFTYTTTTGTDGQTVYHLFRAVAASYQTPQGVVSGIQWVPAEATQVIPAGATPANADFMASFGRSQTDGGSNREWQRDEDRRRRKDKERRERDDKELRKARERDVRTDRQRRPSFNGGYPPYAGGDLDRRMQELDLDRRDREYEHERKMSANIPAPRSRRGSFYGDRPAGYQPAPGGPQYPAPGAYPTPASTAYTGSPPSTYAASAYASGQQYSRPSGYPPSPRPGDAVSIARPVSPYHNPGVGQRPASPYQVPRPVSPFSGAGVPRPLSPYSGGMQRPPSPYQPPIGRAASPRPGSAVYPPGHVMEGQPIRRPLSRAASPIPGVSPYGPAPGAYGAPAYGAPYGAGAGGYPATGIQRSASPRMPLAPGEQQQMLSAPEGFSRPPNLAQPYTHFEMMKIQDMDDFLEVIPRMPLVLVPHDVYHEDWIRFMNDVAMAWSGRLPVPDYAPDGRPPKRSTLSADLIDLWNASFFLKRGVELVLYKGRERRSGKSIGIVDLHLPGFDTYDAYSSPSDSDSDSSGDSSNDSGDDRYGRYGAYAGVYGRQVEGQMAEMREARRVRREKKAEKKMRKREKKRRAKMRELERKYSLYLTCISPREGGLGPQM
ncbi:uncharacterized protein FIBRA_05525 [Fibroporia radiculosa]|uniref:Uncharacterized protein n=1 Tax=Fibroporia radiculosa TaxID=599839 RepID=J4GR71_9APHY|nr:uncharacterized protein FIBRA_05525 [Fibroporia radiculosa]CCM03395.1 predicted protein [Fibroporia radiculosa]